MSSQHDSQADPGKGVADLVRTATAQVSQLVRSEVNLAKVEVKEKAQEAALGAVLLAGAALLGFFAVMGGLGAAVVGLDAVLPLWASLLVVAAVLVLGAGVLVALGRKRLAAAPPVPTQALASAKADVAAIKAEVHR